jgi:hypothetical protein
MTVIEHKKPSTAPALRLTKQLLREMKQSKVKIHVAPPGHVPGTPSVTVQYVEVPTRVKPPMPEGFVAPRPRSANVEPTVRREASHVVLR